MTKTKVLVVEDSKLVSEMIKKSLRDLNYDTVAAVSTGKDAIKKAKEKNPDLVLMDIVLEGDMDGIETAERIRSLFGIPIIYLTSYDDEKILSRAKITMPFGYLIKPFKNRELHATIEMALFKNKLEKALLRAHNELEKRVRERTAELEDANKNLKLKIIELKEWQRMTVGREVRMSELKKEINNLKQKLKEMEEAS